MSRNPLPASHPYAPIPLGSTPEAGRAVAWDPGRDPHFLVASLAGRSTSSVTALITETLLTRGLSVDVIDPKRQTRTTVLDEARLHTEPETITAAAKAFHTDMLAAFDADSVHIARRRFLVVENTYALTAELPDVLRLVREVSLLGWATGHHLVLAYPARTLPGLSDVAIEEFARLALTGNLLDDHRPLAAATGARPIRGWLEAATGTVPLTLDPATPQAH
ncbi:hypothetical protein ACFV4P_34355 [Kitasatospora sp. NPDC059795]|uniref:hypothetical protein n=1 Tax=Kitasatospora sp. NPDC059795 TaxID=3346949 RepID=UPI003659AE71